MFLRKKTLMSGAEAGLAADSFVGTWRYGGHTRGLPGDMLAHKHDGGFTRSELGTRRSDLGISGEGRVVEGNVERK